MSEPAHVLNIPNFRLAFPAFADVAAYPDARIEVNWGLAVGYFGDNLSSLMSYASKQAALNLMTAHLLWLSDMSANAGGGGSSAGGGVGVVVGATVDKVSVQFAPPPFSDGWGWWLSQSPYGAQLWALLSARSAGGFFVPGLPERDAFRRVYGGFGPFGRRQ